MNDKKYDLAERLEDYAAQIIILYNKKPMSYAGDYLAKQLIRSSSSSALNYGEVLGAGTDKDKICLLYTSPSPRDQRGSRMPSSA